MFGKVEIVLKKRARGLVIPEEAVFSEQSRKYVWKVINAKVEKILIKTGVRLEKHIEVTDGLKVGDSVVTKGQLKLRKTGQLVKVLQ
jgi:membrane fusion protein (multidrug efflux system)